MNELIIRWLTEIKKGYAKPCVLYVLSKGEYHAYRITREVQKLTNGHILIAGSNIYPLLRNLVKHDLIERFERDGQRVYKITSKGKILLDDVLISLQEFLETMQQTVIKKGEQNGS
ncbi:MAG: PadR family transcriptional regulator [Candidatus Hodarchaeota archaeon]